MCTVPFVSGRFLAILLDPAGGTYTRLTGSYDPNSGTWTVARTSSAVASPTTLGDIASQITLVPEPSLLSLAGLGLVVFAMRHRRNAKTQR